MEGNMNTSIKKKINGLGRAGQIITTVLIILVSIFGGWLLFYAGLYFPKKIIDALSNSDYEAISRIASTFFGADFPSELCVVGGLLFILVSLKRLANALRVCDTPFSDTVMRRLNGYAWTRLICMTVIIVAVLVKKIFPLPLTLPPIVIVMYACAFGVSVLFSVVILLLMRTFRHGAQLQKEVDETL